MALFLDEQPTTEKLGASIARMDSNPAAWSKQVMQEAHRQLPFLQEYDITVNLTDSAPEQGYAIGYIEAKNPTQMTPGDEMVTQPVKHGRIPIIIREFELHPLDLFMRGDKTFPLTEARFRQAMFRPEEFDSPQNLPPEVQIGDNLEPPFVGNRGGYLSTGREVTGSVRDLPPLLYTLAPLMDNQTIEKVAAIIAADPTVQARFRDNSDAAASLGFLAGASEMEKASADQVWSSVVERIKPNVIQLEKLASGKYRVKWANTDPFMPQEDQVPQAQAEEMAGADVVGDLDEGENLTVSTDAGVKEEAVELDLKTIAEFGQWKVMSLDGRELVGWVFPKLLSFDGEALPMSLFTNGSEYTIQGAIAGSRVGQGVNLPHCEPNGYGCFYYISEGTARATIPFQIEAVQGGEEGTLYSVSTDMGEEFQVQVVPQLQVITPMGEGMYGVPEHFGFLPLTGQLTKLVENPAELTKESEAREIADWGEVVTDGATYSLRGRPFEKLADSVRSFIDRPAAEFLLVAAGASPEEVKSKFASVGEHFSGGSFTFMNLRQITPFVEMYEDAVKTASAVRGALPEARLLVKEAADVAVGDGTAVDAVLSLGFLTPETVSVFLSYIPYLEDTINRLSDLLMATRMGLRIMNESSVRTALFALEETLNGLKLLSQA